MKVCPTCGIEKETDQFHKAKSTKDGLNWQCKECHSKRMRLKHEQIALMSKEIPESKYCNQCGIAKSSEMFSRNRVMHDGLNSICKDCDKIAHRLKAKKNMERNLANEVAYSGRKVCSKCKAEKPIDQFSKGSSRVGGIAGWCKTCTRDCASKSVQRNRERNAEFDPHLNQFATKVCGSCGNILPVKLFGKLRTTKDGLNPFCSKCHHNKGLMYADKNRSRILFASAKTRAKNDGIPFNLELSDIVVPESCPVLGFKFGDSKETRPSLDKIIPALGYVKGNVVVVSMRANRIKSDATAKELARIASFYKKLAK